MTSGSNHKDQNGLNNPLAEMSFGHQITKSVEKQEQQQVFFGVESNND